VTTEERRDENDSGGRTRGKKAAARRPAAEIPKSRSAKESDVTITSTTTAPTTSSSAASAPAGTQKDFFDFLGGLLPNVATTVAPSLGIDPRVAGQTVSSLLNVFGIGGSGKAFSPAISKEMAVQQVQPILQPYLGDQAFRTALGAWLGAAVEPVQAQKSGKAYQPTVDLSKSWFSDITDSIGDAVSSVDWGQVAQVGMRALPYITAALA
jgi:hypothetical protein